MVILDNTERRKSLCDRSAGSILLKSYYKGITLEIQLPQLPQWACLVSETAQICPHQRADLVTSSTIIDLGVNGLKEA